MIRVKSAGGRSHLFRVRAHERVLTFPFKEFRDPGATRAYIRGGR
jgi:hypothetical protein